MTPPEEDICQQTAETRDQPAFLWHAPGVHTRD